MVAAGAVAAGAILTVGAAAAGAATPDHAPDAGAPQAQSPAGACTSGFTKGWASVDMVIENNTGSPLTFDPALSGPSTGHWNSRPLDTLEPGACEVVNAYAPTDVHIFSLNVMYTMPNGDYVPFAGIANATATDANPLVFAGQPSHLETDRWSGPVDSAHVISIMSQDGLLHTHYTLALS
jgi:hypothetical protein